MAKMRRSFLCYAVACVVVIAPAAAFHCPLLPATSRLASRQGVCAVRASGDGDGGGGIGGWLKKMQGEVGKVQGEAKKAQSEGAKGWIQRQLDENMGRVESMQQGVRGDGVEVRVTSSGFTYGRESHGSERCYGVQSCIVMLAHRQ